MNSKIAQSLTKMFDRHRLVFWYDEKQELRKDFQALELEGVTKLEIENNEFGIKIRVLREEPDQKFLLFHEGARPEDQKNWLLDLFFGHAEFRTDQSALWLAELELGPEFAELSRECSGFFTVAKRRTQLKDRTPDDGYDHQQLRLTMMAICCGSTVDARVDAILEALLGEYAQERESKFVLIERANLDGFLFEQLKRLYGYESTDPSIADFAIELFKSCYAMELCEPAKLKADALLFMRRWKDSITHRDAFETLSTTCADILGIENDLTKRDLKELREVDFFELIDRRIISELMQHILHKSLAAELVETLIRARKGSHWHETYHHFYSTLEFAQAFFELLSAADLQVENVELGFKKYTTTWFRIDQLYRKVIFHYRESKQGLLRPLLEQVENYYSNNFLLKLGDTWQQKIESHTGWSIEGIPQQNRFFMDHVSPKKKVVVIISDAMRYEIGEELWRRIRNENRYEAELGFQQSSLPSYTQLGMAALLPHKNLEIVDKGLVKVDEKPSSGTENRSKILSQAVAGGAVGIKADDFSALGKEDSRALVKNHDVVYIYHNRIDYTGDKRESEERVFNATEETLEELMVLVKRLASANATNMLITADHGFLYQNNELDESDFVGSDSADPNVFYHDRRFLLGSTLSNKDFAVRYSAEDLGLAGTTEVQIPRSINRMRRKGSGSRFVHGGSTLQEVVVPVITINKKRSDDTRSVGVDILRGSTSIITSRQFSVVLFQEQAAQGKQKSRTLKAAVYSAAGDPISDEHEICFESTSEDARDRETSLRFILSSDAERFTGQEVVLKLEEREGKTSHYKEYKSMRYILRLNAGFGFDF
ncbi:MAG: BREX-1 system phosphatase PglZ type A [Pontiella sp.]